jgi:hypothetical protein
MRLGSGSILEIPKQKYLCGSDFRGAKSAPRAAAQRLGKPDDFPFPFRPLLRGRSSRKRENCHLSKRARRAGGLRASEFFLGTNRHLLQAVAL